MQAAASWETAIACPATVMVAEREAPVLAENRATAAPLPVPVAPLTIVTNALVVAAVHVQVEP